MLALVVLAHVAGLAGIARLAQRPAPVAETPISVALIELPVPIPPAPAPAPPARKPVAEPPRPKVRPQASASKPPLPTPAPAVDTASAISADALPQPPQPAPREAPAPAPEAPPAIVAARFDAAYLNNPAPAYPPLARRMREEGKAMLRVHVTAEGLPDKVELAESSGFGRLDDAARESVQRWRFVPAKQDGRAIDAWVIVPIVFKLEGN